jgi:hypothetical protein
MVMDDVDDDDDDDDEGDHFADDADCRRLNRRV